MTNHCTLFFEPIDVLLFRDTRPFDPGVSIVAHSVFPGPAVFYGCIRAALLLRCGASGTPFRTIGDDFVLTHDVELARQFLGGPSHLGTLMMRGPLLASYICKENVKPYYPVPRDIVFGEKPQDNELVPCAHTLGLLKFDDENAPRRLRHGPTGTKAVTMPLPYSDKAPEKSPPSRYLTKKGIRRYLSGVWEKDDIVQADDIIYADDAFKTDSRVGIARNPSTHAVEEGMFYVTRPYRFAPEYGFAVDIAVDAQTRPFVQALHGQVVPLGGKGHRARVHVVDGALIPDDLDPAQASTKKADKLVLVTPLPLPMGSPEKVRAMVTDRAQPSGGYDLAKRAPKALRRVLPTGTVLHFDGAVDLRDAYASLFETNDSVVSDEQRMGYGTTLGGALRS